MTALIILETNCQEEKLDIFIYNFYFESERSLFPVCAVTV